MSVLGLLSSFRRRRYSGGIRGLGSSQLIISSALHTPVVPALCYRNAANRTGILVVVTILIAISISL